MPRPSRRPREGDLIINHDLKASMSYDGMVYSIVKDSWGHQRNVHVQWFSDIPPQYNIQHGYCGTNIHNMRQEFTIIRDGEVIL